MAPIHIGYPVVEVINLRKKEQQNSPAHKFCCSTFTVLKVAILVIQAYYSDLSLKIVVLMDDDSGFWSLVLFDTLFWNKRFMLDEMFLRNASKFAKFLEYENPCSFFVFISCYFIFFPNECTGLCRYIPWPWHSSGEKIKYENEKI